MARAVALTAAVNLVVLGLLGAADASAATRADPGANSRNATGTPSGPWQAHPVGPDAAATLGTVPSSAAAVGSYAAADPRATPGVRPASVRLTSVTTTQQQIEVTQVGPHTVSVPLDATSVTVTLYGASDTATGKPGAIVGGTAQVREAGPVRGGQNVAVVLDRVSTMFGNSILEPWLSAPGGVNPITYPADPRVFPNPTSQPGANPDGPRAVIVFTVPAGDIGGLPAGVDFGQVAVPGSVIRNVTFTSNGAAPLGLTSITATPPFAVENTGTSCPANTRIAPGQPCSVAIQVTVNARGPATGTLTFAGNIPGSSRTVALTAIGTTIPAAPNGLTATPGDAQNVLSWMPPGDDGGSPLTGYQILRSGGPQGLPALISTVSPATLVYTDTGLTQGTEYSYTVRAVNQTGASEASPAAVAKPSAALTLGTTSLLPATAGQPYSVKLQASGGTGPYRWAVEGILVPGLALDPLTGEISGTPTDPGQTEFTVRVADTSVPAHEAESRLTVVVQPPAPSTVKPPAEPPGQAARTPKAAGGSGGGSNFAIWAWVLLGGAGLAGGIVAVRRLHARG